MSIIVDGIYLGLALSILLGPIFILLLQSALQGGARAGLMAAMGIWCSDVIIVVATLYFVKYIDSLLTDPVFTLGLGYTGSLVLILVGIITWRRKISIDFRPQKPKSVSSWFSYWLSGFMVNTINPFTFGFWLTTISSYIAAKQLNMIEARTFAFAIIGTIVATDTAKVLAAKLISRFITPRYFNWINKVAAVALIIFGIVLLYRVSFTVV